MRSKGKVAVCGFVVGLALLAVSIQGCGGGSSTDVAALCDKTCKKGMECSFPVDPATCKTDCMEQYAHCSNICVGMPDPKRSIVRPDINLVWPFLKGVSSRGPQE